MSDRDPHVATPIEVLVDGIAHGGEGVGRIDGKVVLIAGALPGERVRVHIVEDRPRWSRARLAEVLVASPDRVAPPCPVAEACGGCDLQHVAPEAARALKTRIVREQLARLGGLGDAAHALVAECRAVGPDLGYRNHVQLHAAPDGRLGFHRAGSHEVVPIATCPVAVDGVNALLAAFGTTSGAAEVSLRALGATPTAIVTPGDGPVALPDDVTVLALRSEGRAPVVVRGGDDGVELDVRSSIAGASLAGAATVEVAGLPMHVPLDAFFQVNLGGAEALVTEVLAAAGEVAHRDVWDLYAGVGLLSLPLARAGAHVLAVESVTSAVAAARRSATQLELDVTVLDERVERVLRRAAEGDRTLDPPEIVVADPPRAGLGRQVIEDLVRLAPSRIVLVACDVASFARDTKDLTSRGYVLERAVPLDLFPMTHHVEVVAAYRRGPAVAGART
jgi:tRNA/tmRNA/rRNA uracil-C5-methylase (TrmA/RlmC/RlmD family)